MSKYELVESPFLAHPDERQKFEPVECFIHIRESKTKPGYYEVVVGTSGCLFYKVSLLVPAAVFNDVQLALAAMVEESALHKLRRADTLISGVKVTADDLNNPSSDLSKVVFAYKPLKDAVDAALDICKDLDAAEYIARDGRKVVFKILVRHESEILDVIMDVSEQVKKCGGDMASSAAFNALHSKGNIAVTVSVNSTKIGHRRKMRVKRDPKIKAIFYSESDYEAFAHAINTYSIDHEAKIIVENLRRSTLIESPYIVHPDDATRFGRKCSAPIVSAKLSAVHRLISLRLTSGYTELFTAYFPLRPDRNEWRYSLFSEFEVVLTKEALDDKDSDAYKILSGNGDALRTARRMLDFNGGDSACVQSRNTIRMDFKLSDDRLVKDDRAKAMETVKNAVVRSGGIFATSNAADTEALRGKIAVRCSVEHHVHRTDGTSMIIRFSAVFDAQEQLDMMIRLMAKSGFVLERTQ